MAKRRTKKVSKPDLSNKSPQELAEMNTAEALSEFWSRPEIQRNYFNYARETHYVMLVEAAACAWDWLPGKLNVLDVGCAAGHLLQAVHNRFKRRVQRMVGVDYAPSVIQLAEQVFPAGEFRAQDWLTNDFPDSVFDVIFCSQTLEHVSDYPRFLNELVRVGRHHIFITIPNGAIDKASEHVNHWTLAEATAILEPYGLRDIRDFISHQPNLIARLYAPYAKGE